MAFIKKKKINGAIYLSEVKSVRIGKKVRHQHLRYIGKQPSNQKVLELQEDSNKSQVKADIIFMIFDHIANEIGLKENFGQFSNIILSLAYAHCTNYRSIKKMDQWIKKTNTGHVLNIENITERSFLRALDDLESNSGKWPPDKRADFPRNRTYGSRIRLFM